MASPAERSALVALLQDRPSGVTWRALTTEIGECGSAVKVYERLAGGGLFADQEATTRFEAAAREIEGWESEGIGVHTMLDESYPVQLRDVLHMPPIVFTRGTMEADARAVAIVGSRKASVAGRHTAARLATGLAEHGFTVVSGGAAGIDAAAHEAALSTGARTVAVIGTGIHRYYPAENRDLHDRVARDGMILSQFWPDAPPTRQSFPMRNAVMSGYVNATVVIEAGEHSGSRIQARNAIEHGRLVMLTEAVLESNRWAQQMNDQPGVHVIAGLADVLNVLASSDHSLNAVRRLFGSVTS